MPSSDTAQPTSSTDEWWAEGCLERDAVLPVVLRVLALHQQRDVEALSELHDRLDEVRVLLEECLVELDD